MSPVRAREMAQLSIKIKKCISCGKDLQSRFSHKYCSNLCQKNHEYNLFIKNWKTGTKSGIIGRTTNTVSRHIRKFIFDKYDSKCSRCGWFGQNVYSNKSVLEINHIDGNSKNNKESNLELICPNCHSLTSNFRNLNRGRGRKYRKF